MKRRKNKIGIFNKGKRSQDVLAFSEIDFYNKKENRNDSRTIIEEKMRDEERFPAQQTFSERKSICSVDVQQTSEPFSTVRSNDTTKAQKDISRSHHLIDNIENLIAESMEIESREISDSDSTSKFTFIHKIHDSDRDCIKVEDGIIEDSEHGLECNEKPKVNSFWVSQRLW